ncbi:hypothetical protein C8R45DRAFT_1114763 [Mycena sanguinolenta]|nr:hypothetical protein C8R45DRAFT_1114763 [Mycena sanguinolenta]
MYVPAHYAAAALPSRRLPRSIHAPDHPRWSHQLDFAVPINALPHPNPSNRTRPAPLVAVITRASFVPIVIVVSCARSPSALCCPVFIPTMDDDEVRDAHIFISHIPMLFGRPAFRLALIFWWQVFSRTRAARLELTNRTLNFLDIDPGACLLPSVNPSPTSDHVFAIDDVSALSSLTVAPRTSHIPAGWSQRHFRRGMRPSLNLATLADEGRP